MSDAPSPTPEQPSSVSAGGEWRGGLWGHWGQVQATPVPSVAAGSVHGWRKAADASLHVEPRRLWRSGGSNGDGAAPLADPAAGFRGGGYLARGPNPPKLKTPQI